MLILLPFLLSVCLLFSAPASAQEVAVAAAVALAEAPNAATADLVAQANSAFFAGNFKEARAFCRKAIEANNYSETHMTAVSVRFFLNRIACDVGLHDYQLARKSLETIERFLRNKKTDKAFKVAVADALFLRGEVAYRTGDSKGALPLYTLAVANYLDHFSADSPTISQPLESMAVCLRKEGHLGRALSAERQAALNDFINMGLDSFRFCETLRFLIQLEREAGHGERAQVIQDLFATSIRAGLGKRLQLRYQLQVQSGEISDQELADIKKRIARVVIGNVSQAEAKERMVTVIGLSREVVDQSEGKPQILDFDSWINSRKEVEVPSTSMVINARVPQKALIYCVHGLGLHGASFGKFGQTMADKGYPVLLPDIRGFGGNANRKGLDLFEPAESLNDIYRTLLSFKNYCPDLPVIVLGESMGGALALQTAAKHGDLVAGLVCSVPSGSRFGALGDGLRVARGLLSGTKQIDVGRMIVHKAVSDKETQERWEADPAARLTLSPRELVKFQEFMDQNEKAAKSLVKMPVLFLQGQKDGLVKPMGTADLYMTVASDDKDFFVVGMEEHLIFEDENYPPWIPDALSAWLESKLSAEGRYKPQ